jgi:hypothetical protein
MKHSYHFLFCLLFLFNSYFVIAQDRIYTKDNQVCEGKIFDIRPNKLRYKKLQNLKQQSFNVKKENVLMVFDQSGRFVIYQNNEQEFNKELENLVAKGDSPNHVYQYDKIITNDNAVIVADVIQENRDEILCKIDKKEGIIPTTNIVAIIYKDGSHKIFMYAAVVATALSKVKNKIVDIDAGIEQHNTNSSLLLEKKATETIKPAEKNKPKAIDDIDDVTFKQYEKKALERVSSLGNYIGVITNKKVPALEANKAIDLGCELFVDEDALVEITNKRNGTKDKKKIRQYFNTLKLLKYDKVVIEWTNINYVSNLRKGDDGNYHGIVSFQQEFKGYIDGKLVYDDITEKNIEVVLKTYSKSVEGVATLQWDVFLEDIGVEVDKISFNTQSGSSNKN